ncbi:hypothetical protein Dda_9380 [Drechslerella dactyloides]|uniref:F-box domain-containing protein n=1 Tax=Drechslerella dactyloides TaxID=74499 RepID=A0AAD6IPM0_DREDA|nr:hypothetical protein Dda_9380 [Drechslerella dactyloides]
MSFERSTENMLARITTIPIELQEHILSYLSWDDHFRCLQVCALWRCLLTSSPLLKASRYTACADPDANSAIHNIFTTGGVSCLFKEDGRFRLVLPPTSGDPCDTVVISDRTVTASEFLLLDEPLFQPAKRTKKVCEPSFDLYIWGVPLCGDQMLKAPWEQVDGTTIEDGYVRLSVRAFLQWLGQLVAPEAGIVMAGHDARDQRVEFLCHDDVPWMMGVRAF